MAEGMADLGLYAAMIQQLLGHQADAKQAYRKVCDGPAELVPPWYEGWYHRYLDYQCGLIPEDEAKKAAAAMFDAGLRVSFMNTPFFKITFRPGYVNCGPNCRAAMTVPAGRQLHSHVDAPHRCGPPGAPLTPVRHPGRPAPDLNI